MESPRSPERFLDRSIRRGSRLELPSRAGGTRPSSERSPPSGSFTRRANALSCPVITLASDIIPGDQAFRSRTARASVARDFGGGHSTSVPVATTTWILGLIPRAQERRRAGNPDTELVNPEPFEAVDSQFRISHGVLNVPMAEVVLNRSRVRRSALEARRTIQLRPDAEDTQTTALPGSHDAIDARDVTRQRRRTLSPACSPFHRLEHMAMLLDSLRKAGLAALASRQ